MTKAIEVTDLKKTYPRSWATPAFEALGGITFSLEQGEVFGFIGPNGAGKSTTIKVLTGIMRPTNGSAQLFGIDAAAPEARRGLGYVPENPSLPDYLTPVEILQMGLGLHGIREANSRQHCLTWLERFDLGAVADRPVRGFSKGMAQRTALAHAMAVRPRLLILDEPLSGLDPIGRHDVVEILAEYRKGGGTIFLTSHVLFDVERLADRFGLIHKGELRAVRSPADLVGMEDQVLVRSRGELSILKSMKPEPGGRWVLEIPRNELWKTLHLLESSGHELIEIRPTLSLELAFLHAVQGD